MHAQTASGACRAGRDPRRSGPARAGQRMGRAPQSGPAAGAGRGKGGERREAWRTRGGEEGARPGPGEGGIDRRLARGRMPGQRRGIGGAARPPPSAQSAETVLPASRMLSAFSCMILYCLGQVRFFVLNDLPRG